MIRRIAFQIAAVFLIAAQAAGATPIEVYILTGQSNSLGTTTLEANYPVGNLAEDLNIPFFWSNVSGVGTVPPTLIGDSANKIIWLRMQQGDSLNPNYWGPEYGFGRTLYEAGRTNILIIKTSNTGSGNTAWDENAFTTNAAVGFMCNEVTNTVATALGVLAASNRAFTVRGLLYIQGEGNSSAEAAIAGTRFTQFYSNLMASINATYSGTADGMRAVIGEIGASQSNPTSQLTTTQQMAAAASNAAMPSSARATSRSNRTGCIFPAPPNLRSAAAWPIASSAGPRS